MRLLLVGGGNMGTALLAGWQNTMSGIDVTAVDPHPGDTLKELCFTVVTDVSQATGAFDVIVLAIKPQLFDDVLPQLKQYVNGSALFLSIAAGKTIAGMENVLSRHAAIIRTMPNTPALIGQGMSVCVANENVSDMQRKTATRLMQAVGDVVWIDDEELMHAVTALSGSGPAYVFAMIEAMQNAGEKAGLPADLALQLALKTVQGAGALAKQGGKSPAELRQQVTSPKGTTAAGLAVLQEDAALDSLMERAIIAAANRSRELA